MVPTLAANIERLKQVTGASDGCGWMYDEVAFLLYATVKFYKPDLVIQTGHLWGKSACVVLEALSDGFLSSRGGLETTPQDAEGTGDKKFSAFVRSRWPKANASTPRLISVDPWPHLMKIRDSAAGIDLLQRLYPGQFQFIQKKSGDFFREFREDVQSLRLMGIVDGDHTPEGCRLDLDHFARLGAKVILVDDTMWLRELFTVTRQFAEENGYRLFHHELYNGVCILTRGDAAMMSEVPTS